MHLHDGKGAERASLLNKYTPSEQVVLSPKMGIPLSKKGKTIARHDCRDMIARRDVWVCFEKCTTSFVIRVQFKTLL